MYKVIHEFLDLQDGNRYYGVGDTFPYSGKSKKRLEELSTSNNKIGVPLIKEIKKPKKATKEEN